MRLFGKIFTAVLLSFIIVSSLATYMASVKQISSAEKNILEQSRIISRFLAKEIEVGYVQSHWPFESLARVSGRKDFLFWWLVRDDGVIHLADKASYMGTVAYNYFPQLADIKEEESAILNRNQNYGIFVKALEIGKKRWLFLLGFSLKSILDMEKSIIISAALSFVLMVLVLGTILYFVVKHLTRPIRGLVHGAAIIGKGDLAYRVKIESRDELGDLANSFNKMAEDLQKTTVSRDELTKEIAERKKAEEEREALINQLKERQESLERQKQEVDDSRRAIKNVAEDLERSKQVLEEQKESLEKINKELDDFTYIVSHDLKEPLRSIDAFSKFIEDDYKDKLDDEGKDYLGRIRVNAGRMQALIEDLLEISRIERTKNPFEEVEAKELIDEVKLRLEYRIKEKNAQIIIPDKLPRVFGDRVRLTEVFANLISNAIKFNDKPNPRIEIGYNQKDTFYEFYVKDNGPGIEEQYFDKIFEIFQRLGKREDNEGTGAGLTIAKKIVQMHKGKIWVESKIGEGSTFYFTIPKEKEFILGKKKIGEILIEKKLVTEEELKKALEEQKKG